MKSDIENREWLNDYMSLKQVNSSNPFTVPDNYFDVLTDQIVSQIRLEELKSSESTPGDFGVPENYFEQLNKNINSRISIEADVNKTNDFGFKVPEGYFSDLEQQIQSRVFLQEALTRQEEAYTLPAGYFDGLTKNILAKTVVAENLKNRGIVKKLFASTAFKYATAACFALAIGGGILINELSNPVNEHKNSFLHKQLSNVPTDDIKAYLQLNVDAGDTQQTVATEGVNVDDNSLKSALKNDMDSLQ